MNMFLDVDHPRAQLSTRPVAAPELVCGIVSSLGPVRSVLSIQATHGQLVAPFAGPSDSRVAVAPCQPLVVVDG